jgi:hypothetical protein
MIEFLLKIVGQLHAWLLVKDLGGDREKAYAEFRKMWPRTPSEYREVAAPTREQCVESIRKYGVQHPLNAGPWNDDLPRDGAGNFLLSVDTGK